MRRFTSGVIMGMLFSSIVFLVINVHLNEVKAPNDHPVHNLDTSFDYTSIQGAIDADETFDGHTILVDAGSYNESVLMYKSLTLLGEDPKTTIIDPVRTKSFSLCITAENVTVAGFTFKGSDDHGVRIVSDRNVFCNNIVELNNGEGIVLSESDSPQYNLIFNNTITDNGLSGIRLGGSHNGLFNNSIANNSLRRVEGGCGLMVINGSNNKIENNTISNEIFSGIRIHASTNNSLRGNKMHDNKFNFGVQGGGLSNFLHDIDTSNRIEERPIYYLLNQSNFVVDQVSCPEAAYIGIVNSNNITIRNMALTRNFQGLLLAYTNRSFVENLNISNNCYGITLFSSHGNTLQNCSIAENGEKWSLNAVGIRLSSSDENTIQKCTVNSNGQCGLVLTGNSRFNIIRANEIFGNYFCGVQLFTGAVKNIVENNSIYNNLDGILLTEAMGQYVTNNTIRGNTLANNQYAIEIDCAGNLFYHNNFKNNTFHVFFPFVYTLHNAWDNEVEGNYWDDYALKLDLNDDGINDYPHSIAISNKDRYPLLGMFSSFNTSLGKQVNVISNSTIDDFEYCQPCNFIKLHVSNMTTNQTHGFCRISISYEVMSEPFNVTINGASPTYWNYTLFDNGTHRWIYFAYGHSTLEIVIVPEFPPFLILPLFTIVTLIAAIFLRKHNQLR